MKDITHEDFVHLNQDEGNRKKIIEIFEYEKSGLIPLCLGKKFKEGDTENMVLIVTENGENSILK